MSYIVGCGDTISAMLDVAAREPFADDVCTFLDDVSRNIMRNPSARKYSDVVTFGFWVRRSSTARLKERFARHDGNIYVGRGVAFHIAPSNVPVNFAYSLAAGLLTGNGNVVRVPSKDFAQVEIIAEAFAAAIDVYPEMRPYIALVRYGHDKEINDVLSSIADTRIVWGGDATIAQLRASPLPPRSTEVTFADRYSLAVIDSDAYIVIEDKMALARGFYNDTYFSDQNACTSPRIVAWTGGSRAVAKKQFWGMLHEVVRQKYTFQPIQAVNKLSSGCLAAVRVPGARFEPHDDNMIVRVSVPLLSAALMGLKDNSGYFFEYDCNDVMDLRPLCDDARCQTIGLLGDTERLLPLLDSGIRGVDRVVPIGSTMDFDLIWDGYNLPSLLTRTIVLRGAD